MSDTTDRDLEGKSPDELERDIEETRARISDEMSALGYKLGPEGLRDSAEDALQDTQDTVTSVTEQLKKGVVESSDSIGGRLSVFIKQNPVPATLFGLGLAWLLKQGQDQGNRGRGYQERSRQGRSDQRHSDQRRSGQGGYQAPERQERSYQERGGSRSGSTSSTKSGSRADDTIVANVPSRSDSAQGSQGYGRTGVKAGAATSDEDEGFRSHFESNYSASGNFEDYEPAYRYGFDLASEDTFKGKPWSDARSDVKRRWDEERNEPWFKFDQAVEHGYTAAQSRR